MFFYGMSMIDWRTEAMIIWKHQFFGVGVMTWLWTFLFLLTKLLALCRDRPHSWLAACSSWFCKKNAPLPTGVITTYEGLELEVVASYKYLGVWLDGTLSFSQHILKLQANDKSILGFLYRNRSSITPAAKLTLIQMTILPMLDYLDVLYRSAGKGALERLDVLYHSAFWFATNAPYRTHHCTL